MKKATPLLLSLILLLAFTPIDEQSVTNFVKKFKNAQVHSGAEKLFIHTDKPLYFAGEDIWFQSYLTIPSTNLPNSYEKILYVELLSPSGETIQKRMFKLENGKCDGTLTLKDNLRDGKYLILAYTNWMRNQGSDFFFKKEITVVAEKNDASITPSEVAGASNNAIIITDGEVNQNEVPVMADLQLTFMPESGDLIAGMLSRVAFVGVNQSGKPMEFSGNIVDEEGNSCANFQAIHRGKGYFLLQAKAEKKYKAVVIGNRGEELEFPLPEVKASGFSLWVENAFHSDSVILSIKATGIDAQSEFTIVAQQDGDLKDMLQGQLIDHKLKFNVSKELFNTGIVHFTLFNEEMIPQCERLAFINHHDELDIQVKGLEQDFAAREKIDLEIEVKDKNGKPIQGEFSMSLTDAQKVGDDYYNSHNLVNYIQLTSNLPGKIEDPAFYFQKSPQAHMAADILMMVNGWRRFKWEKVLSDSIPAPKHPLEQGIYVNGKLTRPKSGKAVPKGMEVTMMMQGRIIDGYSAVSDENGEFQFDVRPFEDTISVVVQTKNRINRDAQFAIDLQSNLSFEAADFYARKLMVDNKDVPTVFYEAEELHPQAIDAATKGSLTDENSRINENSFFEDTTDIHIENIDIIKDRFKDPKERMTALYGAPQEVIGQRQVEQLVAETPWQYGLGSMLFDAVPGLCVINDGRGLRFTMPNHRPHNIYIYIDGEFHAVVAVTWPINGRASRNVGRISAMSRQASFSMFNFANLDPLVVESVDFNTNPKQSPFLNAYPYLDLSGQQMMFLRQDPEAILSIYTKSGKGVFSQSTRWGITNYKLFGFERVREFYAPKYDETDDEKFENDERTTLHWEPSITTDSLGKATVSFYNSDVAKNIRADIAGFSNTGIPGARILSNKHFDGESQTAQQLTAQNNDEPIKPNTFGHILNTNKCAIISVNSKGWSTFSNKEGNFNVDLNTISSTDTLQIEVPGYSTAEITVKQLSDANGEIELIEINQLSSKVSVKEVVKKMYKQRGKNYSYKTYYLKGVYRESIFKGNNLYRLTDFSLYQQKEGYRSTLEPHYTLPLKGRFFNIENYNRHIKNSPVHAINDLVPILDPINKKLSCLDSEYRYEYEYTMDAELQFMGRDMYKVSFDQKNKTSRSFYKGYMLIDKETFALAYINWKQSNKGKKYETPGMFLMPNSKIEDFERLEDSNEAFYTLTKEGLWKLKMASQQVSLRVNYSNFSYNRYFEVIENLDSKPKDVRYKPFSKSDTRRLLIRNVNYTPEDWRETWTLPAEQNIYNQIKYLHEVVEYK